MQRNTTTWTSLMVLLALSGCEQKSVPAAEPTPKPSASAAAYTDSPRPAVGATETEISGKIVEKLAHPSYSYLLLDTGKEKVWAAVPSTQADVGKEVTVERAMLMQGYRSASLKRDFDKVYFGTIKGEASPTPPAKPANPHAAGAGAAAPDAPKIDLSKLKVAKADGPNGKTVADVITNADKLVGKPASVRGVVVKSNSGILGKTWLHLRDGSGKAEDQSNDLTTTLPMDQKAAVGDTVVVHGKVLTNQDVGAGYHYKVLLQGDRLEKAAK